jgi:hypothetical protein
MYVYMLVCQLLQLLHTATAVRRPSDPSSVGLRRQAGLRADHHFGTIRGRSQGSGRLKMGIEIEEHDSRGEEYWNLYESSDIMTRMAKDWTVSEVTFVKRGTYCIWNPKLPSPESKIHIGVPFCWIEAS